MAKGEVRYRLTLDAKDFTSGIKVATKEFEGFVSSLGEGAGTLGKVAGAMGPVGVAAAAAMGLATAGVIGFAKGTLDAAEAAVDFASKISDLSTKTGISGEALQKLGFAGSLVGTTMEDMAIAVKKLQEHIVKAPEDFKQLGLSLDYIRTLAPEKQFEAVGKAIQSIEDPAQRTAATIAFFGKQGQEAMKVLSVGMDEAADRAERLGNIMNDSTRVALDALGDSATVLRTTWEHLLMNFGGAIAEMPEVKQAVDAITDAIGDMSKYVQDNKEDIQDLVRFAIKPMADGIVDLIHFVQLLITGLVELKRTVSGGWIEKIANAMGYGGSGSSGVGEGSGLSSSSRVVPVGKPPSWMDPAEIAKAKAAHDAAMKAWIDSLERGRAAEDRFTANVKDNAYQQLLGIQDVFNKRGKALAKELDYEKAREYEHMALLTKLGQQNAEIWKQMYKQAGAQVGAIFDDVARMIGGAWGEMFHSLGGLAQKFVSDNKAGLGDWVAAHQKAVQAVIAGIQAVYAAYQGGVASKSPGKGAFSGALGGAATGFQYGGGAGAVVGAIVGGIAGFIGGKKGKAAAAAAAAQELAGLRTELARVQEEARKAGINLQVAFDPRNANSMKAAIDAINVAMGLQTEAQNALHDAMDRYGISISQLGPEFAKQELDKQAAQLLQDYKLLTAAGVDHDTVLKQMGPDLNAYVQAAIASGTSIPEAMRPIIQGLIDNHQLLDANGHAYESVEEAGLSFTQTMSEQFGTLIEKIDALVSALLGIPNISRTVTVNTIHTGGGAGEGAGNGEGNGGEGPEGHPLAGGFEGMVNRPRTFLVGERGPEYMSVRKPGEAAGGFNTSVLESKLDGLRDDFRRYQQSQAGSIRDALLLGRA